MAKKAAAAEAGISKVYLKTPKGTRDYGPSQMAVREKVLDIVKEVFKRHGAVTIDTPVFELRDVLMGKYGEEGSKLVYDLAEQGGELCSMRYDLTVPFARYIAMNIKSLGSLKRYQIGKVYRRDNPIMTRGRYREFFQCDFDIAGEYEAMLPDAECVKIIDEVLSELDIGDYEIKVNHRLLLEGMFALSGIEEKDFKVVCSSVDKLDKHPWAEVRSELINEKSIPESSVDRLKNFAMLRDQNPAMTNSQLLDLFQQISSVDGSLEPRIEKGLAELKLLLEYAELLGTTPERISFDPSLARGLDYYTGTIYEAVVKDVLPPSVDTLSLEIGKGDVVADQFAATEVPKNNVGYDQDAASGPIGSVAAGGRYDKLVGMFLKMTQTDSKKKKSKDVDIPCVGVSFGIERLFTIMELKAKAAQGQSNKVYPTDVYVMSPHSGMLKERMKLCSLLWSAGIRCEFSYKANARWLVDIQHCEKNKIPIACLLGNSEVEKKCVIVKQTSNRDEDEVPMADLIKFLRAKLKLINEAKSDEN